MSDQDEGGSTVAGPPAAPAGTSAGGLRRLLFNFGVALGLRAHRSPDAAAGAAVQLTSTDLAIARTYLAAERTLMGWIRTGLSMISFGFTLGKLAEAVERDVIKGLFGFAQYSVTGLARFLVLLGTLSLAAAAVQHSRRVADLAARGLPHRPSVAFAVALILSLLGLLALAGLVLEI